MIEYKEPMVVLSLREYNELLDKQYDPGKYITKEDAKEVQSLLGHAMEMFYDPYKYGYNRRPMIHDCLRDVGLTKSYDGLYIKSKK